MADRSEEALLTNVKEIVQVAQELEQITPKSTDDTFNPARGQVIMLLAHLDRLTYWLGVLHPTLKDDLPKVVP